MFSLLKGAFVEINKLDEYFIAILGLDGAGKTVYLERVRKYLDGTFKERDISKIPSTVGLNHVAIRQKEFILNFWDLGGESELRSLWDGYLNECNAIIFMADSNDQSRFDEIISCLEKIMSFERVHSNPFLILLNKCDYCEDILPPVDGRTNRPQSQISNSPVLNNSMPSNHVDSLPSSSLNQNGWQSFDLDNNDPNNDWEVKSDCTNISISTLSSSCLMTAKIRNEFEERFGSIHRGDFAIISISALQNINVKKSVNWLINSIISLKKEFSPHKKMIHYMLLFSRQGKLRLQKWYVAYPDKNKKKITRELITTILARKPKMCAFLEYKELKIVYKRYASLYFLCAVEQSDNELLCLETIHRYVELLDRYFGSVCELDIIFNFEKAYFILDEFLLAGEIQETSKKQVLKAISAQDLLQDEETTQGFFEDNGLG